MSDATMGVVDRQSESYRRGLVLGLTLAEIMLLLVFCFLIATGVVLKRERDARIALQLRLDEMQLAQDANKGVADALARDPQLREALKRGAGSAEDAKISEYWRRLTESDAIVTELQANGQSRAGLSQKAAALAQLADQLDRGLDVGAVERQRALGEKIAQRFGGTAATDEQVLAALDQGLAAGPDAGGHRWPPIIRLSEADGYFFASGRAELAQEFVKELQGPVTEALLARAKEYNVDVIEVVGHTDEQPVGGRRSNLDLLSFEALGRQADVAKLQSADNAGLGLARAIAVVAVLRADPRLAPYKILPLSGAQLVQTDDTLSLGSPGDVRERRRIEIRLRKSAGVVTEQAPSKAQP